MFSPSSPITGTAQTGLTSPTYTFVSDLPPSANAEQVAVTALGGTQTGVEVHSVSRPFTMTMFRPVSYKQLPVLNPNTGALPNVPRNTFKLITRKGVTVLSGQNPVTMTVTTEISVPAGADLADPESVRAALSAHFGLVSQCSAGIGDSCVDGII